MFVVWIQARPDAFDAVHAYVQRVVDLFGRALTLGFFAPAVLDSPIALVSHPPSRLEVDIQATRCPPGLLRVLWGMCEWGRQREAIPLQWQEVFEDGQPLRLASVPLPPVTLLRDPPFRLARPRFIGFGDQMVALIEFSHPPGDEQLELLEAGLQTWKGLMFGGFPPEGSNPGESAVSATSGYLIMPATYQWFVEGVAADSDCIDLLIKFFDAQAARLRVVAVDVET